MSMLAACGGLAYLHATREQTTEDLARTAAAPQSKTAAESVRPANDATSTTTAASTTEAESSSPAEETTLSTTNVAPPESVAQWIKDTQSSDAKTRAAAIAALADAPKAQAMPALERVLETGEPDVDRHIALRSMHALALRDGDATGQIRDVMRHAIYHGDDDGVTQTAQSLLDDIEAEFATREQPKN
ncbi:MAG TPA: hypothetical protein VGD45_28780 [Steroidobacter sp.]|uniref:hypothetical protein n=1 Tax=Steroidobacter sp. TaxID=1978227 RepID=UPI002ED8257E